MSDKDESIRAAAPLPKAALPHDQVHALVSDSFREVLGRADAVDPNDSFFDLGGDSFQAVRLAALLSRHLGAEVPALAIVHDPTIAGLVAAITVDRPATSGPVLSVHTDGTRPPWFLVSERSNPEFLLPLALRLGSDQPVHVLRPEALWRGRVTQRTLQDSAADQLREVVRLAPAGPLAVFGNCSDGAGAYELARQLTEQGREVVALALSDAPLPAADPWLHRPALGWLRYLHQPYGSFHRRRGALATLARDAGRVLIRPSTARMVLGGYRHHARALRLLGSGGPIPEGRELAYMRYLYAHRFRTYTPPPAPDLSMTLLTSDQYGEPLRAAWSKLVGVVDHVALPTTHQELLGLRPPLVDRVAKVLHDTLDRGLAVR